LNIESLGTIQTISVYNVLGQEVINKALNSTSTSLDVSSLNSGIYVVKTVVDGVTSSTKFIKQ
jgi:endoglucanase